MTIGKPSYKRNVRLRELFLQEITKALQDIQDPGLSGFITITDLKLTSDGKTARVYYSLLGSERDRVSTQQALDRSAGYIRKNVFNKLRLKIVPKITFLFDDTPEEAQKIERVLNRIYAEKSSDSFHVEQNSDYLNKIASSQKPKRRRRRGR